MGTFGHWCVVGKLSSVEVLPAKRMASVLLKW